jgi:hypothetical protein
MTKRLAFLDFPVLLLLLGFQYVAANVFFLKKV